MKEQDILDEAKERYREAQDGWADVYRLHTEDMKFVYDVDSGQWPGNIRAQRDKDGRPVITCNKLQKFVRQLRGDQMMNRPRIKVIPVDDVADPKMAALYNGLIRQIEYLSDATVAYDTAYMHAISGSIGYFRLITQYVDENSFDQEILIRRITNPVSVHFDPNCMEFTLSDAQYCFIEELVKKKQFEKQYPKSDMVAFSGDARLAEWLDGDSVRVAEYFYKDKVKKKIALLRSGAVVTLTKDRPEDFYYAQGDPVIRDRDSEETVVKWCKLNGVEILESSIWPGRDIPVIPVFGDEVIVEGKRYYLSLARGAKGPQQMYNYWARLSLDTPIPTPWGWTTIGEVREGDTLFDENGKQCKVLGLSPIFDDRKCFKITFSNRSEIVADDEHLWDVEELVGKQWIKKTLHTSELDKERHRIRVAKPLDLPEVQLPISPYALGLWITDGDANRPKICANSKTVDELSTILEEEGFAIRKGMLCKSSDTFGIAMLGVRKEFVKLNLLQNKHIPQEYLRASFHQRLYLLQGMMDGDGTCKQNGQCCFATFYEHIAEQFAELLRSLGFKGGFNKQADGMYVFAFAPREFPVFRLSYKLSRQFSERGATTQPCRYTIVSIEEVAPVPVRCIKVDSPNSLFLAGKGMIPTHNTAATETVALAPKAPFIVDHRQIKGFENEWEDANITNRMYIRYNAVAGLQKPSREPQTQIPTAIMSMMQQTAFDIEDHLGRYEASKGEASNERSGKAIIARINQSDKGTYTFVDNLTRAIVFAGRQMIDLIPKTYDTRRALQVMGESGEQQTVMVNNPVGFDEAGNVVTENDLSVGKFDLIATVGASYSSKRQEMVETLIASMQYAPSVAHIITPLVFKYSDFPGSEEVYEAIKQEIEAQQAMAMQNTQTQIRYNPSSENVR